MGNMGRVAIFTVGHKPFDLPNKEGYEKIQVGSGDSFAELRDNTGDNISFKNPFYCELTALYWAWKNYDNADIMGLAHYRRYFVNRSPLAFSPVDDVMCANDIKRILSKKKVILKGPGYKSPNSSVLYRGLKESEQKLVLVQLEKIIKEKYPEYLNAYHNIAYGYMIHHGNMFITTKDIFNDYCEWLFTILDEFEKRYDACGVPISSRQCGYVGEYLLGVYMHGRFSEEELYYADSIMIDETSYKKSLLYSSKNMLRLLFPCLIRKYKENKSRNQFIQSRKDHGLVIEEDILKRKIYCITK